METTLLKLFILELKKISLVGGMAENPVRKTAKLRRAETNFY